MCWENRKEIRQKATKFLTKCLTPKQPLVASKYEKQRITALGR